MDSAAPDPENRHRTGAAPAWAWWTRFSPRPAPDPRGHPGTSPPPGKAPRRHGACAPGWEAVRTTWASRHRGAGPGHQACPGDPGRPGVPGLPHQAARGIGAQLQDPGPTGEILLPPGQAVAEAGFLLLGCLPYPTTSRPSRWASCRSQSWNRLDATKRRTSSERIW